MRPGASGPGSGPPPLSTLRVAFRDGLVRRLYSPLALDYFDTNWVEASSTEEPPPEAVLQVVVTRWDTSMLHARRALVAAADVRIHAGSDAKGEPLWGVSLSRRLELQDVGRSATRAELEERAARLFVAEALRELPERDPLGH